MVETVIAQEGIEYYQEKYKNKTKVEQVFYDAMGNPVHILPGKTGEITRARRVDLTQKSKPRRKGRGTGRKRTKDKDKARSR